MRPGSPHLGVTFSLPQNRALLKLSFQENELHIRTDCRVRPYEIATCSWGDPLIRVQPVYPDQLPEYTPSVTRSADC